MTIAVQVRPFAPEDADRVHDMFVAVNRMLAPPSMRVQFEAYIERSLHEEIDRVAQYYGERGGGFWVAVDGDALLGMFGLEPAGPGELELRRMYVAPQAQRRGIARYMLQFAEDECRRRGVRVLVLSTSKLQQPALALYRNSGFRLLHEEKAETASNKTVGGGIHRYHFSKLL